MSSLALMRWLESTPERYDVGMNILTLGRARRIHRAVADAAVSVHGTHVLEIGCGTGSLTAKLVARGARVVALDQNPEMLAIAKTRLVDAQNLRWLEQTAAEVDQFEPGEFDAVVASFAFSELSRLERHHVLKSARECIRAGGLLVIADEVRPSGVFARITFAFMRVPQALLGWFWVGSVSRPIPNLVEEITGAGFRIHHEQRFLFGTLVVIVAQPNP